MKTQVQTFQFHSHSLRVIVNDNGEPWFIAKDVADHLGFSDTQAMTRKLEEDDVKKANLFEIGLHNNQTLISESGLYLSVLSSRKPETKAFKKWVTAEVLPSLRKTGSYGIPKEAAATIQALQTELLKARPRLNDTLKLRQAGFSKARTAKMLGFGETTIDKEVSILKACGYPVATPGTQVDLFGGEL